MLHLWAAPVPDREEARAAFGVLYTDPVRINGVEVPLGDLVARSVATHRAFERLHVEVLDVVETPDRLVLAFELTARHVGTWQSPLGDVPATQRTFTTRIIDVLTVRDGRVSAIQVVMDEASVLRQVGARFWSLAPTNDDA